MAVELKELLEKRANLVNQAREVLKRGEADGKLSDTDKAQYDRTMAEAMTITQDVEARSSFIDRQKQLNM